MLPQYNYHTHTYRCKHASGEDRDYIEAAIKAGFKILGFSDHCPWIFKDDYVSFIRMEPKDVDGYFTSLEKLKEEYKNDIRILIGFESEYVPEMQEEQDKLLEGYPLDYMILGQHFLGSEPDSVYTGSPTKDETILERYVDLVIEGLKTGRYLYLAHPDLLNFTGADEIYEKHMTRLCEFLKEADIPLEINMLGAFEGRHYPYGKFLKIAKKTGNTCIVGIDAHAPEQLLNKKGYQIVEGIIEKYSLPLSLPPLS